MAVMLRQACAHHVGIDISLGHPEQLSPAMQASGYTTQPSFCVWQYVGNIRILRISNVSRSLHQIVLHMKSTRCPQVVILVRTL